MKEAFPKQPDPKEQARKEMEELIKRRSEIVVRAGTRSF